MRPGPQGLNRDEHGGVSILSIFLTTAFFILGGLAIDAAQAWRVQAILQVTADAAAHGAAVRMSEPKLGETPTSVALDIVERSLAPTHLENTAAAKDVEFGYLTSSGEFVPALTPRTAVRVTLSRSEANENPEPTFLLHLIGLHSWNIHGRAVARIAEKNAAHCSNPLLSVQARVQVENPILYAGICVKAAAGVTYGLSNYVMSDEAAALIDAVLDSAIGVGGAVSEADGLFGNSGLLGGDLTNPHSWKSPDKRELINALVNTATQEMTVSLFDPSTTTPGETYHIECTDNGVLYVPPGSILSNIVLLSECPIKFAADVTIEASIVLGNLKVLATSDPAISVTADTDSPYSQNCAPAGGLMLLVYADLDTRLAVPALADPDSPFGAYLGNVVGETGGLLGDVTDMLGDTLSDLTSDLVTAVNDTTASLSLDQVCIGAEVMLTGDTVTLATAN